MRRIPPHIIVPAIVVARRFLWIAAFAFWMGGFSFYGGVVITVGAKIVTGGESEFGFITQQVTFWLNVIGGVAMVIFLVNLWLDWGRLPRWGSQGLAGIWIAMAAILVGLMYLHPMMDRLLDATTLGIRNRPRFRMLHNVYLLLSSLQWGGSLLLLAGTVWSWARSTGRFSILSKE